MPHPERFEFESSFTSGAATTVAALLFGLLCTFVTGQAQAQTFKVLYSFSGGTDGADPSAGMIVGPDGNLYGTTTGTCGTTVSGDCGTVFKLNKTQSGWVFTTLYRFRGGADGVYPGALTFGPDGSLYGTTVWGGGRGTDSCGHFGCGTVFKLTPTPDGSWTETVLYRFNGPPDIENPGGTLVFDAAGNLYGTGSGGANTCGESGPCGAAYELIPSGGDWNEIVIWNFGASDDDGAFPNQLTIDGQGNLYGTTFGGGHCYEGCRQGSGTAFELIPSANGWTENILHNFNFPQYSFGGGVNPDGGLIFDKDGDLFGTTFNGWPYVGGTFFQFSPEDHSWAFSSLFDFPGPLFSGPTGTLAIDSAGNFYGVRFPGFPAPNDHGTVFKLTYTDNGWTYSVLHEFTNPGDGEYPAGTLALDASGNLYGTARQGGAYGYGVVWEITP